MSRWSATRFLLPLGVFVVLVLLLITGLKHSQTKDIIISPLLGRAAPSFNLPNLLDDKNPVTSAVLKNRWSLVNVWGTWCVECRVEQAALMQIQRAGQVPIIGIDWKDDDAQALAWLAQYGNPYEHIAVDHDGRAAINWGVYGAPESFLISPAGTVVYKHVGPMTAAVWNEQFLPRVNAGS